VEIEETERIATKEEEENSSSSFCRVEYCCRSTRFFPSVINYNFLFWELGIKTNDILGEDRVKEAEEGEGERIKGKINVDIEQRT